MKTHGLYRGISFDSYDETGEFVAWDVDLVKRDILNHIFTRKGERLMMPTFGTTIPDMLFEPITDELLMEIEEQMLDVINYDPRVELVDIQTEAKIELNMVTCSVVLNYVEMDLTNRLDINLTFEN